MGERTASGSAYDAIAGWYDAWVGDHLGDDPYWTATEPLLGEVAGRRVLDLACGQGRIARRLADLGADVVAVDHSAGLLAIARRHQAAHPRGSPTTWATPGAWTRSPPSIRRGSPSTAPSASWP